MKKIAGRKVQRNSIVTNELLAQVNPENIDLGNDFLDYLRSVDRAGSTIDQYKNCLLHIDVYKRQILKKIELKMQKLTIKCCRH